MFNADNTTRLGLLALGAGEEVPKAQRVKWLKGGVTLTAEKEKGLGALKGAKPTDPMNPLLWKTKEAERGGWGSWSFAAPGEIHKGSCYPWVTPGGIDPDYEPEAPEWHSKNYGPDDSVYPAGTEGIITATTQHADHKPTFMASGGPLVADHKGGGEHTRWVYDTDGDGKFGQLGPLHHAFWVKEQAVDSLVWAPVRNYTASAAGDSTAWGTYVSQGDGERVIIPNIVVNPGGHVTNGHVDAVADLLIPGVKTKESFHTIGTSSWEYFGPECPGHCESDKHQLGVNSAGEPTNTGHLWPWVPWYLNKVMDGPLDFEPVFHPQCGEARGAWLQVHLRYDPVLPKPWVDGPMPGAWRWSVRIPEVVAIPPYIPDDRTPPPVWTEEPVDRTPIGIALGEGEPLLLSWEPPNAGTGLPLGPGARANAGDRQTEMSTPSTFYSAVRWTDHHPYDGRFGSVNEEAELESFLETARGPGPYTLHVQGFAKVDGAQWDLTTTNEYRDSTKAVFKRGTADGGVWITEPERLLDGDYNGSYSTAYWLYAPSIRMGWGTPLDTGLNASGQEFRWDGSTLTLYATDAAGAISAGAAALTVDGACSVAGALTSDYLNLGSATDAVSSGDLAAHTAASGGLFYDASAVQLTIGASGTGEITVPGTAVRSEQFGGSSAALGLNSLAIGSSSYASATNSSALGSFTDATAEGSTAVGSYAQALHTSVALGHYATTDKANQCVIGRPSSSDGYVDEILWGQGELKFNRSGVNELTITASVKGIFSNDLQVINDFQADSIGVGVAADGTTQHLLVGTAGGGQISVPSGTRSEQFGANSSVGAVTDSLAMGERASTTTSNSTAIGANSSVTQAGGTACGQFARVAGGTNASAYGYYSYANAERAFAMGGNVTVSGPWSAAIGYGMTITGTRSFAMGYGLTVSGDDAFGQGYLTSVTARYGIGIGAQAGVSAWGGIGIGRLTVAGHNYSIALGMSAVTTQANEVVFGAAATSYIDVINFGRTELTLARSGVNELTITASVKGIFSAALDVTTSLAVGTFANIGSATQAVAAGDLACHTAASDGFFYDASAVKAYIGAAGTGTITVPGAGTNSEQFGATAVASNTSCTAVGYDAVASATQCTAVGKDADATNSYSSAFGERAKATGNRSSAFGRYCQATGNQSCVFGIESSATNTGSCAFGYSTDASGYTALAIGNNTTASGNYSMAFAQAAQATGAYAMALGREAVASATESVAIGKNSDATASGSFAFGTLAQATHAYSMAFGKSAATTQVNEIVFGAAATSYIDVINFGRTELTLARSGVNELTITASVKTIFSADAQVTGSLLLADGATGATNGAVYFASDTDTCHYLNAAGDWRFDVGAVETLKMTPSQVTVSRDYATTEGRIVATERSTLNVALGTGHHCVLVDTDDAVKTATLPAAPDNGRIYLIKNVGTSGNALTIDRNGKNIDGAAANLSKADGESVTLVYEDTEHWQTIA
ncbi:MAG: hypothetical protein GY835_22575 [bacterium]|nr:hypothetical protein [bacterium]